jgi:hypothetical protein
MKLFIRKKFNKFVLSTIAIAPSIVATACRRDNASLPVRMEYQVSVNGTSMQRTRFFLPNAVGYDHIDNSKVEGEQVELEN